MARILSQNGSEEHRTWYEQIEPTTIYEKEFEDQILIHARSIYPQFYVVPFKKTLESANPDSGESATVKPDLAFISKDYSEWWVVEVEMGYHDLEQHVIPQVQKLLYAEYTHGVAEYLVTKQPELAIDDLSELIRVTETRILVILNHYSLEWINELNKIGASVAVFEVFRGPNGKELFRANGMYPSLYEDIITECTIHPAYANLLGLVDTSKMDLPENRQIVRLTFRNCLTEWIRWDSAGSVWLRPMGRNPLKRKKRYQILRRGDGALVLHERPS